jgi:hypothetical protein
LQRQRPQAPDDSNRVGSDRKHQADLRLRKVTGTLLQEVREQLGAAEVRACAGALAQLRRECIDSVQATALALALAEDGAAAGAAGAADAGGKAGGGGGGGGGVEEAVALFVARSRETLGLAPYHKPRASV